MTLNAVVKMVVLALAFLLFTVFDMNRKQSGRPHLPEGEAKDVIVQTRVSEADRDLIQQAADRAGVKVSQWVRERILAAARAETRRK